MKLEKMTIKVTETTPKMNIEVLFNPNTITITKSGWTSSEKNGLSAKQHADASLSVELFFDTSLPKPDDGLGGVATALIGRSTLLPSIGRLKDVRKYTDPIFNLTEPRSGIAKAQKERPPICQLYWGGLIFQGVLKSVTQTFTRFLEDGTPVRASLKCEFEAWEDPVHKKKALNPIDDPIRIVKRGETLSSIATEEYGDPALWRVIAKVNRMDNPRQLNPGQRLTVPPLPPDSLTQRR
jgi:LysM repeat protein